MTKIKIYFTYIKNVSSMISCFINETPSAIYRGVAESFLFFRPPSRSGAPDSQRLKMVENFYIRRCVQISRSTHLE